MARSSRRNSALKFYTSGKAAKSLHGLTSLAGSVLSSFDTAVQRATVGLKRRAGPAVSRAVRENYGVNRSTLAQPGMFRIEQGSGPKGNYLAIWASTRRLPLVDFSGRWSGPSSTGATAEIERGRRKAYIGAFIAKGRIRGQVRPLIYTRIKGKKVVQKYGYHEGRMRESIHVLRAPGPFEMISGVGGYPVTLNTRRTILAELAAFYTTELQRQFKLKR